MLRFGSTDGSRILIAAHRGVAGGNVPCNSICAFQAALNMGADIIELDVSRSTDGELYVFHPGMERIFLKSDRLISEMHSSEVDKLRLVNQDTLFTEWGVPRLREAFELIRGRAYINIDKFWTCPGDISKIVREMGMQDQVLIKTDVDEKAFRNVEEVASDLPFMVIAWEKDEFSESLFRRNMRYVGVEAIYKTDDAPICQREYTESLNKNGLIAWANSLLFNYKTVLAAGHSDDVSVSQSPDQGWGWLADRGFNIIQTDWPLALRLYLEKLGKH
ncbi:MAG: glycerophosphodiester phosphodiesterase family protein [Clostridia bacterium]|nr:glycerophosphodiester phosphodiesterase family protein [Clostridia bacterium]